jgi:cytochrome c
MSRFVARSLALWTGALALSASLALASEGAAGKRNYEVAKPDHYPYHGIVKDDKGRSINVDGAIVRPTVEGTLINHSPVKLKKNQLGYGTDATPEQIAGWNVDVRPDGKGLPPGQMTVEEGAEVFANNCASCHGDFGEGVGKNPVLVGGFGTLTHQAKTGGDEGPEKTLGSYAPYIAPFFWYIKMAMPLPTPKKLSNDEVYGILGYLLQLNEIQVEGKEIEDDTVIDAEFLKKVVMPNKDGFEYNNLRKPDTHNTRCMKDCVDPKKVKVMHIVIDATDSIEPPVKVPRYSLEAPKPKGGGNAAEAEYKASCAACHDSGAAGAPVVGNADDWAPRIKQGKETLYEHAIKGFNGMPPKGGNMSLSDDQVKAITDYMAEKSK